MEAEEVRKLIATARRACADAMERDERTRTPEATITQLVEDLARLAQATEELLGEREMAASRLRRTLARHKAECASVVVLPPDQGQGGGGVTPLQAPDA